MFSFALLSQNSNATVLFEEEAKIAAGLVKMLRVEDSSEAGLLQDSARGISAAILHVSRRQCYAVSACVVLIAIAAIVSVYDIEVSNNNEELQSFAPAPEVTGHGRPAPHPSPVSAIDRATLAASDQAPYETICDKTVDRAVCLNMFRSYPNSNKALNLQQLTETAMEAAEHALNVSYMRAQAMKKRSQGNAALEQCVEVFADALDDVKTSLSLVAGMDDHNPGTSGADVKTFMSAAMTNQDTCQEGIDEVGPFPGSDQFTGAQAKSVDTMLSIALTFVNHLTTPEPDHHRRHLLTKSTGSELDMAVGRRGLLALKAASQ